MAQIRKPLKKLNWKHKEVARRLIMNQDRTEIAIEVGYAPSYIDFLVGDPIFKQEMEIMQDELHQHFIESRASAMDALNAASHEAAEFALGAMRGKVKQPDLDSDEVEVPVPKRIECAWDVLDRTGNKAPSKSINVHASLQDMMIEAYTRRKNGGEMKKVAESG